MVIRGGENIYCAEVEAAIYEHPAVYEAAVFGMPHERLGEEVVAAVLPASRRDAHRRGAAGARRAASWPPFKVPSQIVFVRREPLPRNAAGKILKRELRDELTDA